MKWRIFEWRAIIKGDEGKRKTFRSGPEKVHQWRTWQGEDASNVERVISLHNIKPELILFHDHGSTMTHILFPSTPVVAIPTDIWSK